MAHGYFKAEGKPMAVLCHGTVGMQHAAMAIYNAYCDRVPVYLMAGNSLDATLRRPGVEWAVAQKLIELHGGEIIERYESDGRKSVMIFLPLYV